MVTVVCCYCYCCHVFVYSDHDRRGTTYFTVLGGARLERDVVNLTLERRWVFVFVVYVGLSTEQSCQFLAVWSASVHGQADEEGFLLKWTPFVGRLCQEIAWLCAIIGNKSKSKSYKSLLHAYPRKRSSSTGLHIEDLIGPELLY